MKNKFLSALSIIFGFFGFMKLAYSDQPEYATIQLTKLQNGSEYFYNQDLNRVEFWLPLIVEYNLLRDTSEGGYFIGLTLSEENTIEKTMEILSTQFPQTPIVMGEMTRITNVMTNIPELQSELNILSSLNNIYYGATVPISKKSFDILMGSDQSGKHLKLELNSNLVIEKLVSPTIEHKINNYCSSFKSRYGSKISAKEIIKEMSSLRKNNVIKKINTDIQNAILEGILDGCFALQEKQFFNSNSTKGTLLSDLLFSTTESQKIINEPQGKAVIKILKINKQLNLNTHFIGITDL